MSELIEIREKATQYGTDSLSSAELLGLLLNTSEDEARDIIRADRITAQAIHEPVADIEYSGRSRNEALMISAIKTLSVRMYEQEKLGYKPKITSIDDVNTYLAPKLRHLNREKFLCISLDVAKRVIKTNTISVGSKKATTVNVSEVLRHAVINDADYIIVAHNHPSGTCQPSKADINITKHIKDACEIINIKLLDHIIIAGNSFVSIMRGGYL